MPWLSDYAVTYVLWPCRVVTSVTRPWLSDYVVTLWPCVTYVLWRSFCDHVVTYVLWPCRYVRSVTMPWRTFFDVRSVTMPWRTFCDVRSVTMPWRTFCDHAVTYVLCPISSRHWLPAGVRGRGELQRLRGARRRVAEWGAGGGVQQHGHHRLLLLRTPPPHPASPWTGQPLYNAYSQAILQAIHVFSYFKCQGLLKKKKKNCCWSFSPLGNNYICVRVVSFEHVCVSENLKCWGAWDTTCGILP